MLKIYDCSNSDERPPHRHNSFGPKQNDIIADLKRYAQLFDAEFVLSHEECDVILTNDVFPSFLKDIKKPKVKRMDGVYWQYDLANRNEKLNASALEADCVIFISSFSWKSLRDLYPEVGDKIKNYSIILNTADNSIFYPKYYKAPREFILTAIASSWTREDKRFNDLIVFAKKCELKMNLIGDCPYDTPDNVVKFGYIADNSRVANILRNDTDIFVNFSYRDACPKVVSQAIATGLPILFANSGGLAQQVSQQVNFKNSHGFYDGEDHINKYSFQKNAPSIDVKYALSALKDIIDGFDFFMKDRLEHIPNHMLTLLQYYNILREAVKTY